MLSLLSHALNKQALYLLKLKNSNQPWNIYSIYMKLAGFVTNVFHLSSLSEMCDGGMGKSLQFGHCLSEYTHKRC